MATAVLPSTGNVFLDAVVLLNIIVIAILLFVRSISMPSLHPVRLRNLSMAIVLLLPIGLAFAQAASLGLRFWESFPLGTPSLLFLPFMALWGFAGRRSSGRGSALVPPHGPLARIISAPPSTRPTCSYGDRSCSAFSFLAALLRDGVRETNSLMYVGRTRPGRPWMVVAFFGCSA